MTGTLDRFSNEVHHLRALSGKIKLACHPASRLTFLSTLTRALARYSTVSPNERDGLIWQGRARGWS
jgi:GTP cyclohydrolase I